MKRELKVSFAVPAEGEKKHLSNRTASQEYKSSLTLPRNTAQVQTHQLVTPRSPLYPENIIPQEDRATAVVTADTTATHEPIPESNHNPTEASNKQSNKADHKSIVEVDPAHGAILIYPKKIDNLRRFRILFVGLLLFISSSTQGMHSLFGTLYLQVLFRYDVRKMAIVYLCGQAVGMFVFPFGALYDWFGPRVVVATGSVIAALGHLLFALTFGGHLETTVVNCAVFYSIMCWGCYALNVAVLPAVLSHMPRDRGQPTGLLETFSGLGSSFFSCLFRGFFSNNFENLMWFLFAVTVVVGVVGTWYLEDAPYVVNRWQQRHITLREQLRKYLIRNRYMSQLVPQRRYKIMTVILILLNFYLTIQAVVVAYLADEMTDGKRRGIAIGAIAIILLILVLIIPLDAVDGPTEQDKQVIAAAKEKEEELIMMQEERYRQRHLKARAKRQQGLVGQTPIEVDHHSHEPASDADSGPEVRLAHNTADGYHDDLERARVYASSGTASTEEDNKANETHNASPVEVRVPPPAHARNSSAASPNVRNRRGGVLSHSVGLPLYEPTDPERMLLNVYMDDDDDASDDGHARSSPIKSKEKRDARAQSQSLSGQHPSKAKAATDGTNNVEVLSPPQTPAEESTDQHTSSAAHRGQLSFTVRVDDDASASLRGSLGQSRSPLADSRQVELTQAPPSTYDNPRVETITLCGEVYVAPVYQTSFLESLTYLDMWMIVYTTMCVWGVGLTMVGNWNIYIMLLARYGGMQQKHYILFAAMAGVCTAGGRVFLGMYERVLQIIRERTGAVVVPTLLYPITSVGLLIGCIFWIALPGDKVLVLAYLIGPSFYGISTSMTPYVLGTIFDRDLGMHYGFCFFAGAVGFVLCYWCSWYLTYRNETSLTPRGDLCIGQRRCMNRAVGIYVALVFSSIFPAYILHRRYSKLVKGELVHRRVIVPHLMRMFRCCGCCCGGTSSTGSASNTEDDSDGIEVDETRNAAPQLYPENPPSYP